MKAVNWNVEEDFTNAIWQQNVSQLWFDTEFNMSKDLPAWEDLSEAEKTAYKRVLAGLTGLDTQQGDLGMPLITIHTEDMKRQAVYSFMGFMEQVHAKSYSTIFTTLISSKETKYLLEEWLEMQEHLQFKGRVIERYYKALLKEYPSLYEQYMARVASVFLESFVFYSGFFYPLYLSGQGKMTTSGEIIRKILLDETIHGNFTGWDAQTIYEKLSPEDKKKADLETIDLLNILYRNEEEYTEFIYKEIGLTEPVLDYVKYNANRALTNLGREHYFTHNPINPIILNAMDTSTKNHDFFSTKGDGYVMTLNNSEEVNDDDFFF